jgi:hypothetical protein
MKKFFLLVSLGMMSISSFAQVQWDVTVRKEPDYSKYGVQYQSTDLSGMKTTAPRIMQSSGSNDWLYSDPLPSRSNAESVRIVSDEIQLFNGIKLGTNAATPIRARVVTKSNGYVEITCMGIKNGQNWKPCSKPIMSLQSMYNNAHSESEKSMILDLMDLGSYLLDNGNEMYIIK